MKAKLATQQDQLVSFNTQLKVEHVLEDQRLLFCCISQAASLWHNSFGEAGRVVRHFIGEHRGPPDHLLVRGNAHTRLIVSLSVL